MRTCCFTILFRYEDFKAKSVLDLLDGEKAVVTGKVVTPANVQYYGFKRNRLSFKIKQDEAVIAVSFLISLIYKIRWSLIRILLFWKMGSKEVSSYGHEDFGSSDR